MPPVGWRVVCFIRAIPPFQTTEARRITEVTEKNLDLLQKDEDLEAIVLLTGTPCSPSSSVPPWFKKTPPTLQGSLQLTPMGSARITRVRGIPIGQRLPA
ncbi:MAG: hypothetical protein WCJ14_01825 [Verrucomicrobiota bacterium]